ncbi:hypothetical protein L3476_19765 [Paenibacillus thiaminolyticus]|uniref:hypothetical protein n=1 Tax=Paenibacillus thiaminolyticus TaxID=49283 RepID=UPI00234FF80A|nr:hypothetical protein [Paenibacillus thiaminolyticus]WCR25559.1 hypothetical protein L3476_19765 [Paenibacillus thiaminolyticus]
MEKSEKSGLEQWRSRAEELLLGKMTLAEKIGQTVQYGRCEERERELIAEGEDRFAAKRARRG